MLTCKVEQSADALRGGGMAAKQAHRIMRESRRAHLRKAGMMTLQLVERSNERARIAGQFEPIQGAGREPELRSAASPMADLTS
jgi:hypothetical protein